MNPINTKTHNTIQTNKQTNKHRCWGYCLEVTMSSHCHLTLLREIRIHNGQQIVTDWYCLLALLYTLILCWRCHYNADLQLN